MPPKIWCGHLLLELRGHAKAANRVSAVLDFAGTGLYGEDIFINYMFPLLKAILRRHIPHDQQLHHLTAEIRSTQNDLHIVLPFFFF